MPCSSQGKIWSPWNITHPSGGTLLLHAPGQPWNGCLLFSLGPSIFRGCLHLSASSWMWVRTAHPPVSLSGWEGFLGLCAGCPIVCVAVIQGIALFDLCLLGDIW